MENDSSLIQVTHTLEVPNSIEVCGEKLKFYMGMPGYGDYYEGRVRGEKIRIHIEPTGRIWCKIGVHHWEHHLMVDGRDITALWLIVDDVSNYLIEREVVVDQQTRTLVTAWGYLCDMIGEVGEDKCDSRVLDSYRLLDGLVREKAVVGKTTGKTE